MSNPYMFNYQQYSPQMSNSQMNTSPTFANLLYHGGLGNSTTSSLSSSSSSLVTSNYSLHNSRLRYYLSKSFDAEDDMEFCPDIPESFNSNHIKKFNPYTASVFAPTAHVGEAPALPGALESPRTNTPRIRKPVEIVNPHTKVRIGSPASHK
ncbi:hypothetical protein C7M61_001231 [Candidozyma pseudohaemuli]|uniref:Uncharacterized protein n=1 Tax=Candidozyma pseudohaemuli TaxID=418784 RepID=A0A2P7Z004_9ASCO|nr:hypothetical protein C7M61_001231 [[Candida] pseudohaemulonii]PSK41546.1 hypothetical protein C7M61_001231 [[Candida] pseudohaemulonii]